MNAENTGRFIALLRKQKGYTQKELAEKLAVTDKAISRWETGKGFPDTALLGPLSETLGVSIGELLAGEKIAQEELKPQTDRVILDTLRYSKRMLARMCSLIFILAGAALLLSPLFLATRNYSWIAGIVLIAVPIIRTIWRRSKAASLSDKAIYGVGTAFQAAAFILELLPYGTVLIFAPGPGETVVKQYSYFSLTPVGYANFTPLLTGVLTAVILFLELISLCRYEKGAKGKNSAFICSVISVPLSLMPLVLFGIRYMTPVSFGVTGCLGISLCLQAVANRKSG